MFQTVGGGVVGLYGDAMELPLYRHPIKGTALCSDAEYKDSEGDEVNDLFALVKKVQQDFPELEAVSTGAILSNYQRVRVESVCKKLGLVSLAFMWMRNQSDLLQEMVNFKVNAIIVKVACIGLNSKHLGQNLEQMQPVLEKLNQQFGANVCGEGGEYETIVLDCPLFKKRIAMYIFC